MIYTCIPLPTGAQKKLDELAKNLGFTDGLITEFSELAYEDPDKEGVAVKLQFSRRVSRNIGFKTKRSKK